MLGKLLIEFQVTVAGISSTHAYHKMTGKPHHNDFGRPEQGYVLTQAVEENHSDRFDVPWS